MYIQMNALLLPFLFNSIHSMSVMSYILEIDEGWLLFPPSLSYWPVSCDDSHYSLDIPLVHTPSNAKFIEFNPWIPCTLPVWSLDPITIKPALCGANDSVVTPQILYDM